MTINEFVSAIDQKVRVECGSLQERNNVLQFLEEIGYKINDTTERYLRAKPEDTSFMHPGLSNDGYVTIWRYARDEHNPMPYYVVEELTAQDEILLIDERNEEEFSAAFSELISGGVI